MQDQDYDDLYEKSGYSGEKGPALAAYILVVGAIVLLVGVSISFQGSLQF